MGDAVDSADLPAERDDVGAVPDDSSANAASPAGTAIESIGMVAMACLD
jgi:hypothetical protein